MAVLKVRPKGLPGTAYMAAIMPFRHLVVYHAADPRDRAGLAGEKKKVRRIRAPARA